jgi:putative tricarboxylic transport membrane protein
MKKSRKLRAGENAFTILLLAFSLFILVIAYRISGFSSISSPGAFPMAAGLVMLISAALVLVGNRKLEKPGAEGIKDELKQAAKAVFPKEFIIYTFIIIGYMILIQPIHFIPSSFVFMVISMIVLRGSGLVRSLLISAATLTCIYVIFEYFFRVVMP